MSNIEFSASLNSLDVYRVNKHAFNSSLCMACDFFIQNKHPEGVKCFGSTSKSDALIRVPFDSGVSYRELVSTAKCEP